MIKIIPAYFLLAALTVAEVMGQNFNRPLPPGFPRYEFRQTVQSSSESNYLMTPLYPTPTSSFRHLSIMDENGYLKWYDGEGIRAFGNLEYHPGHNLFSYVGLSDDTTFLWKNYVMDMAFNLIDSLVPEGDPITDAHEFRILENGNYLIVGTVNTDEDLTGYVFDGVPGGNPISVRSFVIQEFENGNLIFNWKSIDHIHPEEFIDTYNFSLSNFDYAHGNSVEEDTDGNFLVSFRHLDAVYKINRITGEVIWILGGRSNQFDFVNDGGFSGQHDVRLLPNGHISLFDNGNSRPEPRSSRAVHYELDFNSMTATRVWEYHDFLNTYSSGMGSYRVDPDGERIIGYGIVYRPNPNFIHLNAQGQIVSELYFQDTIMSYRATLEAFTLDIDQPEITCVHEGNELVLSAPDGLDSYIWSTGESTQSISIADTGVYQVWVGTGGSGLIGSTPFFVDDLSDPCGFETGVEGQTNKGSKIIVARSNGRAIDLLVGGDVAIYNSVGQLVLSQNGMMSSTLDFNDQPNGIYVLVLEANNGKQFVERFVKL